LSYSFLLASWGGPGNIGPLLTAGRRLRDRGHRVRFITDPEMRGHVEAAGFGFTSWRKPVTYDGLGHATNLLGPEDARTFSDQVFFGPAADYAADTLAEFDRAPTDALLAIDVLLGAALAAESAGLPCAMLSPHVSVRPLPGVPLFGSGFSPPRTPAERAFLEITTKALADFLNQWLPALNTVRQSLNLAPLAEALDLYDRPERLLLGVSSAFDFPADHVPENVRYVGPLLDPAEWAKAWTPPWSSGSARPRALVSFSTTDQGQTSVLQRVIDAIGAIAMDAVATTGPALEKSALIAPKNVTLLPSAPHDPVMNEVSFVVTHGGAGTVSRALVHGLPLLVLPMGRDQSDNAARVVVHGAGLALPPSASEAEIAVALNRLINEPQFGATARRLGEIVAADLKSTVLVDEMEAIAANPTIRASTIAAARRDAAALHPK
jgi:UDP:flavonoid glycosyltransferase YjiC (YdhE family)